MKVFDFELCDLLFDEVYGVVDGFLEYVFYVFIIFLLIF